MRLPSIRSSPYCISARDGPVGASWRTVNLTWWTGSRRTVGPELPSHGLDPEGVTLGVWAPLSGRRAAAMRSNGANLLRSTPITRVAGQASIFIRRGNVPEPHRLAIAEQHVVRHDHVDVGLRDGRFRDARRLAVVHDRDLVALPLEEGQAGNLTADDDDAVAQPGTAQVPTTDDPGPPAVFVVPPNHPHDVGRSQHLHKATFAASLFFRKRAPIRSTRRSHSMPTSREFGRTWTSPVKFAPPPTAMSREPHSRAFRTSAVPA